jgi:hypothetical protein
MKKYSMWREMHVQLGLLQRATKVWLTIVLLAPFLTFTLLSNELELVASAHNRYHDAQNKRPPFSSVEDASAAVHASSDEADALSLRGARALMIFTMAGGLFFVAAMWFPKAPESNI